MLPPLPPQAWSLSAAAHLLNRAGFGASPSEIVRTHERGMRRAVAALVDPVAVTKPGAAFPRPQWANPAEIAEEFRRGRRESGGDPDKQRKMFAEKLREQRFWLADLQNCWLQHMLKSPAPLIEKMTLFWHGHFATSQQKVRNSYFMYVQNETFRSHALGRFGPLVKAVSRDPAMIIWLDLRQSDKKKPNENFARELMELFTLGEGLYTEEDIREVARCFTGYKVRPMTQSFDLDESRFDDGEKTVFGRKGVFSGDDIIDLILARRECAEFITRKIWGFFVYEDPPASVVDPLARWWQGTGYDLRVLMSNILSSAEFYSPRALQAQIKSPVQWLVQACRELEMTAVPTVTALRAMRELGQELLLPPNVKGWDGGKTWITTATLLARYNLAADLAKNSESDARSRMLREFAQRRGIQPQDAAPDFAALVPAGVREDPAALVETLAHRFFPQGLPGTELTAFIEFAATNVPLDDRAIASLAHIMMSTPRYQLC